MSRAVAALLEGLVDYAGLFPPAGLAMPEAVAAYARYRRGPHRAMLGRLVVPATRLDECASAVAALPAEPAPGAAVSWRISALAGAADAATLAAFNARQAGRLIVDTIEAKADSAEAVTALARAFGPSRAAAPARADGPAATVFVEIPVQDDPTALVEAIGAHGLRAKIRTGGVTPDAFPSPAQVLRFLVACARAGVPFKATAGLHHPMRGEYALTYAADAPRGTMYGFVNIFLAAALLRAGVDPVAVAPLLEERDAAAIVADDDAIRWRGHALTRSALAAARRDLAGSFGSCSFEEPVQDLTSLGLL